MKQFFFYFLLPYKSPLVIEVKDRVLKEPEQGRTRRMTPVPKVECYSGYKLHETPRFIYLEHKKLAVLEVKDRWYGPDHSYFKVLADDGQTYLLRYDLKKDQWAIESLGPASPRR